MAQMIVSVTFVRDIASCLTITSKHKEMFAQLAKCTPQNVKYRKYFALQGKKNEILRGEEVTEKIVLKKNQWSPSAVLESIHKCFVAQTLQFSE